jgi:hypothetical protein
MVVSTYWPGESATTQHKMSKATMGLITPSYFVTTTLVTDAGRLLTPTLSPSGGEEEGEGVITK